MRLKIASLFLLGVTLVPSPSFAGWGALACDVNRSGACSVSSGRPNLGIAEYVAMGHCNARGYRCYIFRWEHNECIYGPNGSYTCN